MLPFLKFIIRRLIAIPFTLIIITAVLYGIIMLAPAEERATLYRSPNTSPFLLPEVAQARAEALIEEHGLRDPYPVQYIRWLTDLLQGNWGWSPLIGEDVLDALVRRTAVTVELIIFSLLVFIPLGFISGVISGWRPYSATDRYLRFFTFLGTAIPPFILGLVLLSIFYVGLGWFPLGRTGIVEIMFSSSGSFENYTGLLTLDGLLNLRPDVTLDALRRLVLPVITVSLFHWATLSRVTRASMADVKDQDYIKSAQSRGLKPGTVLWGHAFRNAMPPGLTSSALAAASLVTSIFVIEVIFNRHGLSELVVGSMGQVPDAPLALGVAVYTVLLVIPIMLMLDIIKGIVDPRLRREINQQ